MSGRVRRGMLMSKIRHDLRSDTGGLADRPVDTASSLTRDIQQPDPAIQLTCHEEPSRTLFKHDSRVHRGFK